MQEPEIVRVNTIKDILGLLSDPAMQYYPICNDANGLPWVTNGPEIKFFGEVKIEVRETAKGPDEFWMIGRRYGWAVALVLTKAGDVVLNIQSKPGLAVASLEMPAGGIGKDPRRSKDDICALTVTEVLRETGYTGTPLYLGFSIIESGKFFDPAVKEFLDTDGKPLEPGVGRGLRAHLIMIDEAELVAVPQPRLTEKIKTILVPVPILLDLIRNSVLVETSAVNCVTQALLQGRLAKFL